MSHYINMREQITLKLCKHVCELLLSKEIGSIIIRHGHRDITLILSEDCTPESDRTNILVITKE